SAGLVPGHRRPEAPRLWEKDVDARHTAGQGVFVVIRLLAAAARRSQNGHRPGARNFGSLEVFPATANEAERTACPGLEHRGGASPRIARPIRNRALNEPHIIGIMLLSSEYWRTTSRTDRGAPSWQNWRGDMRHW